MEKMTVNELRALAKKAGLSGYSNLTKAKLIELLRKEDVTAGKKTGGSAKRTKKNEAERKSAHAEAPDKYFQFGEHERDSKAENGYEFPRVHDLPDHYETDNLTLLVRDERAMFVLWELGSSMLNRARADFGSEEEWDRRRMVFRLYRVGDGPRENAGQFDVFGETGRYHMFTPVPDRDYYCILGFLRDDDSFVELMRSNTVHAPRTAPVKSRPKWARAERRSGSFRIEEVKAPPGWPEWPLPAEGRADRVPFSPGASGGDSEWVKPEEESQDD